MRSTVTRADKSLKILEMVTEDGATPAGVFPTEHAQAVLEAQDHRRIREVRESHGKGDPPPRGGT